MFLNNLNNIVMEIKLVVIKTFVLIEKKRNSYNMNLKRTFKTNWSYLTIKNIKCI